MPEISVGIGGILYCLFLLCSSTKSCIPILGGGGSISLLVLWLMGFLYLGTTDLLPIFICCIICFVGIIFSRASLRVIALSYWITSTWMGFFLSASLFIIYWSLSSSVGYLTAPSWTFFRMNLSLIVTLSVRGGGAILDLVRSDSFSGLSRASRCSSSSSASFFYLSTYLARVPIFLEASEIRSLATRAASCLLSLNMSKPNSKSWFLDFPVKAWRPGRCGGPPIDFRERAEDCKDDWVWFIRLAGIPKEFYACKLTLWCWSRESWFIICSISASAFWSIF